MQLDAALAPLLDRKPAELDPVEHALLLIGSYELQHRPEVPFRVVINEAVRLARRFGATDGHKFVNGVLDRAARLWRVAGALSAAALMPGRGMALPNRN